MKDTTKRVLKLKDNFSFKSLFDIATEEPDLIASEYLEGDTVRKISYGKYKIESERYAASLADRLSGLNRGAFVAIHLDNSPQWPYFFWGLVMSGYNPVMLDFRAPLENIRKLLSESGAVAIITEEKHPFAEGVMQIGKADFEKELKKPAENFTPVWANKLAFCTSGTTAEPRIYVYREEAFVSNLYATKDTCENSPLVMPDQEVKYLAFLPAFHIYGFYLFYGCVALTGKTVVYPKDKNPKNILEACRIHRITHLPCVPLLFTNLLSKIYGEVEKRSPLQRTVFEAMCKLGLIIQRIAPVRGQRFVYRRLFSSLHRKILGTNLIATQTAGAYMAPATMKKLLSMGFPMYTGLGSTETVISAIDYGTDFEKKLNCSMGLPFSEFRLIDPNTKNERKDWGELQLKSSFIHTSRLQGGVEVEPDLDSEGYFHTGDIVKTDKDGCIYFLGRNKETIIPASGENIYPDEVESFFSTIQGIDELCVLGIENSTGYEDPVLVVKVDRSSISKVSTEIAETKRTLPDHKQPRFVYLSEESLPKTGSMKVKRQKLKREIENGRWPLNLLKTVDAESSPEEHKNQEHRHEFLESVRIVFAEVLNKNLVSVREDDDFITDLGGDSLSAMQLKSELEDRFSVEIDDVTLLSCRTPGQFATKITSLKKEKFFPAGKIERKPVKSFVDSEEYRAFTLKSASMDYNPFYICHDSTVRDTSFVEGKELLNFASYNYLGLSGHPETVKAAKEAIDRYGSSASGSRILTGEKSLYRTLEQELAEWKGTEDAIVLVSGNATNTTFVGNFCGKKDLILYDALSHDSIVQGVRLSRSDSRPFPHNDFKALRKILESKRKYYEKVLIIVEGVYSMDGDIAPVPEFVKLKKEFGAMLMVDEAHSAGVIGKSAKGVDEHFNLSEEDVDVRMGTLSKGLGSCGGYLAGKKALIEYLRYSLPGFIFSVGITPANAAAALAGIRVLKKDRTIADRLHQNIKTFIAEAKKHDFNTCLAMETAIIPILVGDDDSAYILCKELKERGVFIVPAVYPAVPRGEARLRFCVTSEHKREQIVEALEKLQVCADELGIQLPKGDERRASRP